MTTFALLPGLLSDRIVWEPLAETLDGDVFHADLTRQSSITDMAQSVLAETDGPLVVIGHSMGGRVAMETARIAPERVRALVLANTGYTPKKPGEEGKRQAKIDLGYRNFAGLIAEWLPPMVAPDRIPDEELMARLIAMSLRQDPESHERQIRALVGRPDAGAYLPSITCPILLLTGAQDGWSPAPQHREIAELAPHTELHVVEGAGHFLPVEQPDETVRLIQDWLSRHEEKIGV